MIRQSLQQRLAAAGEARVDLSPLIDVVFILLIFFIVTTVFVRESGLEVDKPRAASTTELDKNIVILAISARGEVMHGGASIGVSGVRGTLSPLLRSRPRPVLVQADGAVSTELLVRVIDQAKLAGAADVFIATQSPR